MNTPHSPRLSLATGWLVVLPLCLVGDAPAASPSPAKVDQVIVTFKTHFDIGYTDLAVNVVQRYRTTMIDQALRVCDQSRGLPPEQQFVWTIPGWPMSKILEDSKDQTAQRKQHVLEAFKSGRFVVHALPFTTHTELLEAEDLVRGLGFSSRLSRMAGLPLPRDAKMTDVPCHSWILPTLLKHAGVDFLHLGCNAGSRSPEVPRLFWWEGPDGSRLLTMYTADSYGTGLVPPADWPHRTWLALIHTGDNHGPPTPEEVKQLLDGAKTKLPGVKVRIGRLSDFGDAILAEKPDLPVVRADMPDTWIHGPMCDPEGARTARNDRPVVQATEALNTLLRLWGLPVSDIAAKVASAYEKSLLYGEHTWGGAQYWITQYGKGTKFPYGEEWKRDREAGRFKKLEASWAEHTGYIENMRAVACGACAADAQALADSVQVDGPRIVVFNPSPWKRDGIVKVVGFGPKALVPLGKLSGREQWDVVPADGQGPTQRWSVECGFTARDVPPLGYRTYRLVKAANRDVVRRTGENKLETPFFKAEFDLNRCTLRSLVDKRSGRELIDDSAPHGCGQYLYERFDANQVQAFVKAYGKLNVDWVRNEFGKPLLADATTAPYSAYSPKNFELQIEEGPRATTVTLEKRPGLNWHDVSTRFTFSHDQPHVDISLSFNKAADPWPEACWLCLPFKVDSPQFRLARLGSIVDPAVDIVPGSNHHLFGLNGGMAITDPQGRGVGLCPLDSPLVSLETPGCWKYSRDFVPHKARAYICAFNNQWTTNFRMWNEGPWLCRVRIWPIDRYDAEASLATPSAEARLPLLGAVAKGKAGAQPPCRSGIELSRRGIAITAFGKNPDGPGTVLRLWEQAGQSGPCEVRLPAEMKAETVQPVDLRGQPRGAAIPVANGRFTIQVGKFAPATVLFP